MTILEDADPVGLLMLLGFFKILLDFLLWGAAGYVLLRSLGLTDRYWHFGGLVISIAYLLIDQLLAGQAALALFAQGEAKELLAFGIDDAGMSLLVGYGGFAVGRLSFRAAARKASDLSMRCMCPSCGYSVQQADLHSFELPPLRPFPQKRSGGDKTPIAEHEHEPDA